MSFPVNYETAMTNIANLAMDQNEPGYVRVRALIKLVSELSPLNERHLEVKRELNIDEAQTIVSDRPRAPKPAPTWPELQDGSGREPQRRPSSKPSSRPTTTTKPSQRGDNMAIAISLTG